MGDIEHNGNYYCYKDHWSGYKMVGADRWGSTAGLGKAICDYDPSKAGQHYWKNCALWGYTESKGDEWCRNDFGPNYKKVGAERGGCLSIEGRAICGPS